jgi:hypothetical protein
LATIGRSGNTLLLSLSDDPHDGARFPFRREKIAALTLTDCARKYKYGSGQWIVEHERKEEEES